MLWGLLFLSGAEAGGHDSPSNQKPTYKASFISIISNAYKVNRVDIETSIIVLLTILYSRGKGSDVETAIVED
jgi:hypothetical protein